tara:strand:+ start:588 stop:1361 length:774 start_codon:yes stop_codon:yes gene_type:complete
MIDIQQTRNHVQKAIDSVDLELYPFPHAFIENVWPEEVYKMFHTNNPLDSNSELVKPWLKKHSKYNPHYQIRKQIDCYELQDEFWKSIQEVLFADNWYAKLIMDKYKTYFATHFGPLCKDNKWLEWVVQEWFVQRHDVDYFIGPHTDRHDRVFTNIFTFPLENTHEHLGTSIYTAGDGDLSPGGKHFGFNGFEKIKQMPYRKNCLFIFFKSRWAFHAVEKIKDIDVTKRYGMQIQVYEKSFNEITPQTEGYETLLDT